MTSLLDTRIRGFITVRQEVQIAVISDHITTSYLHLEADDVVFITLVSSRWECRLKDYDDAQVFIRKHEYNLFLLYLYHM